MARRYSDDPPGLTRRERLAAVERLEWLDQELAWAASWLDTRDEPRAAAMILSAQRSILAAAYLVQPATERELLDVVEQAGYGTQTARPGY